MMDVVNKSSRAVTRPVRYLVVEAHRSITNSIKRLQKHPFTLTDLPLELRLLTWIFVLTNYRGFFELGASSDVFALQTPRQPSFTKICRALRQETLDIYYKKLHFEINLRYRCTLPFLMRGLKIVGPDLLCNLRYIYISTNLPLQHDCRGILRRDTQFKIDISNGADSQGRIRVTCGPAACLCQGDFMAMKEVTRACLENTMKKMFEKREKDSLKVEDMVLLFEGFSRFCGGQGMCVDG